VPLKFPKSEKYNFNKNLVKRHKLVTHLDRFLATEPENFVFTYEPKEKDDAWHPSGNCTPPPTELYYYATEGHKEPRDIPVALQKTFLVGHFWHQLLQHAVLGLGFADEDAIERKGVRGWGTKTRFYQGGGGDGFELWRPFHWATGSGDVAPCVIPTQGDFVVDFKTMSSHQFRASGIPDWAAAKYEAQINIYMDWFDTERALIVALNKDSPHDMKEFEFVRNQPLIDAIYNKWEFVSECLDADEAPSALDDEMFDLGEFYTGPVAQ
jgi:hypothetical protein